MSEVVCELRHAPGCHSERSRAAAEARNRTPPGRGTPLGGTKKQTQITQITLSRFARSQKRQKLLLFLRNPRQRASVICVCRWTYPDAGPLFRDDRDSSPAA